MAKKKSSKDIQNIKLKNNYFKNLGKSISYALGDAIKEQLPESTEKAKAAVNSTNYVKDNFKGINQSLKSIDSRMKATQGYKDASEAMKNVKSALKTGKFYDKDKVNQAIEQAFDEFNDDSDIFGSNDDIDFSDDSDDIFSESSDDGGFDVANFGSKNKKPSSVKVNDNRKALKVQNFYGNNNGSLSVSLAKIGMDNDNRNTNVISNLFMKHTETMSGTLDTINENISSLVTYSNDTLNPFIEKTTQYYEDSINSLKGINETISQTFDLIKTVYSKEEETSSSESTYDLAMRGDLKSVIKRNLLDALDEAGLGMLNKDTLEMMKDTGDLKSIIGNPLGTLMKFGFSALIGENNKYKLNMIDSLAGNLPKIFNERMLNWKHNSKSGLLGFLGRILGAERETETSLKLEKSKAELTKAQPFNYQDHIFLTKVIPTYLSEISRNTSDLNKHFKINPSELSVYNSSKGEFQSEKKIKQNLQKNIADSFSSDSSSITNTILGLMESTAEQAGKKLSKDDIKSRSDAINRFLQVMVEGNGTLNKYAFENDSDFGEVRKKLSESFKGNDEVLADIWAVIEGLQATNGKRYQRMDRSFKDLSASYGNTGSIIRDELEYSGIGSVLTSEDAIKKFRSNVFKLPTKKLKSITSTKGNNSAFSDALYDLNFEDQNGSLDIEIINKIRNEIKESEQKLAYFASNGISKNSKEYTDEVKKLNRLKIELVKVQKGSKRSSNSFLGGFLDDTYSFLDRVLNGYKTTSVESSSEYESRHLSKSKKDVPYTSTTTDKLNREKAKLHEEQKKALMTRSELREYESRRTQEQNNAEERRTAESNLPAYIKSLDEYFERLKELKDEKETLEQENPKNPRIKEINKDIKSIEGYIKRYKNTVFRYTKLLGTEVDSKYLPNSDDSSIITAANGGSFKLKNRKSNILASTDPIIVGEGKGRRLNKDSEVVQGVQGKDGTMRVNVFSPKSDVTKNLVKRANRDNYLKMADGGSVEATTEEINSFKENSKDSSETKNIKKIGKMLNTAVVKPLRGLFGTIKEKGKELWDKVKNSDFYKKYLEKYVDKAKGKYKDTFKGEDGVFSKMSNKIQNGIAKIFNLEDNSRDDGKDQTIFGTIKNVISRKFIPKIDEISNTLFGKEKGDKGKNLLSKFSKGMKAEFKGKGKDILSDSGLGLLAGLFLPGGPIVGGIVGAGVGLVKNSQTLQNVLFGDNIGEKNGLQKFASNIRDKFKKKFPDLKFEVGAGLLGTLFLPGGPIVAGITGGLLGHYGKKNKDKIFDKIPKLIKGVEKEIFGDFKRDKDNKRTGRMGIIPRVIKNVENSVAIPFAKWSLGAVNKVAKLLDTNFLKPFKKAGYWFKALRQYGKQKLTSIFKKSKLGEKVAQFTNAIGSFVKGLTKTVSTAAKSLLLKIPKMLFGGIKRLLIGKKVKDANGNDEWRGGLFSGAARRGSKLKQSVKSKLAEAGVWNDEEYDKIDKKSSFFQDVVHKATDPASEYLDKRQENIKEDLDYDKNQTKKRLEVKKDHAKKLNELEKERKKRLEEDLKERKEAVRQQAREEAIRRQKENLMKNKNLSEEEADKKINGFFGKAEIEKLTEKIYTSAIKNDKEYQDKYKGINDEFNSLAKELSDNTERLLSEIDNPAVKVQNETNEKIGEQTSILEKILKSVDTIISKYGSDTFNAGANNLVPVNTPPVKELPVATAATGGVFTNGKKKKEKIVSSTEDVIVGDRRDGRPTAVEEVAKASVTESGRPVLTVHPNKSKHTQRALRKNRLKRFADGGAVAGSLPDSDGDGIPEVELNADGILGSTDKTDDGKIGETKEEQDAKAKEKAEFEARQKTASDVTAIKEVLTSGGKEQKTGGNFFDFLGNMFKPLKQLFGLIGSGFKAVSSFFSNTKIGKKVTGIAKKLWNGYSEKDAEKIAKEARLVALNDENLKGDPVLINQEALRLQHQMLEENYGKKGLKQIIKKPKQLIKNTWQKLWQGYTDEDISLVVKASKAVVSENKDLSEDEINEKTAAMVIAYKEKHKGGLKGLLKDKKEKYIDPVMDKLKKSFSKIFGPSDAETFNILDLEAKKLQKEKGWSDEETAIWIVDTFKERTSLRAKTKKVLNNIKDNVMDKINAIRLKAAQDEANSDLAANKERNIFKMAQEKIRQAFSTSKSAATETTTATMEVAGEAKRQTLKDKLTLLREKFKSVKDKVVQGIKGVIETVGTGIGTTARMLWNSGPLGKVASIAIAAGGVGIIAALVAKMIKKLKGDKEGGDGDGDDAVSKATSKGKVKDKKDKKKKKKKKDKKKGKNPEKKKSFKEKLKEKIDERKKEKQTMLDQIKNGEYDKMSLKEKIKFRARALKYGITSKDFIVQKAKGAIEKAKEKKKNEAETKNSKEKNKGQAVDANGNPIEDDKTKKKSPLEKVKGFFKRGAGFLKDKFSGRKPLLARIWLGNKEIKEGEAVPSLYEELKTIQDLLRRGFNIKDEKENPNAPATANKPGSAIDSVTGENSEFMANGSLENKEENNTTNNVTNVTNNNSNSNNATTGEDSNNKNKGIHQIGKMNQSLINQIFAGKMDDPETKVSADSKYLAKGLIRIQQILIKAFNMSTLSDDDSEDEEGSSGPFGKLFGKIKGLFSSGNGDSAVSPSYGYSSGTNNDDTPYYSQNDSRWANANYGTSSFSKRGCAPTAMAMVASKYKKSPVSPIELGEVANNYGYSGQNGTNSEFFDFASNNMGLKATKSSSPTPSGLRTAAKNGPIILSGADTGRFANSPYTRAGHSIVATGVNEDGSINIQDPRGSQYNRSISAEELAKETGYSWRFKNNTSAVKDGYNQEFGGSISNAVSISDGGRGSSSVINDPDMLNNFPYLMQQDPRWGSLPYTSSNNPKQTLSSSACGPTSMAMILRSFGNNVSPVDTANWSVKHGYRTADNGTAWGFFPAIAKDYGLNVKQTKITASDIDAALSSGKPLVASMGPPTFTSGGHFITLVGKTDDGQIMVNDPVNRDRSMKRWGSGVFSREGSSIWAFDKDGKGSIGHLVPAGNLQVDSQGNNVSDNSPDTSSSSSSSSRTSADNSDGQGSNFLKDFLTGISDFAKMQAGIVKPEKTDSNSSNNSNNNSNGSYGNSSTDGTSIGTGGFGLGNSHDARSEIVNLALEMMPHHEGKYDTVVKSDVNTWSYGILGFHGEAIPPVMNDFASRISDSKDRALAEKYARSYNKILTSSEADELKALLNRHPQENKMAQGKRGYEFIDKYDLMYAWDPYEKGTASKRGKALYDPRSLVVIANIANAGYATIDDWLKNYHPVTESNMDNELKHVTDSLVSNDSYFGRANNDPNHKQHAYGGGWTRGIKRSYETVKNWIPTYAKMGFNGPTPKGNTYKYEGIEPWFDISTLAGAKVGSPNDNRPTNKPSGGNNQSSANTRTDMISGEGDNNDITKQIKISPTIRRQTINLPNPIVKADDYFKTESDRILKEMNAISISNTSDLTYSKIIELLEAIATNTGISATTAKELLENGFDANLNVNIDNLNSTNNQVSNPTKENDIQNQRRNLAASNPFVPNMESKNMNNILQKVRMIASGDGTVA